MNHIDMTGLSFGSLIVINEAYRKNGVYWNCVCVCGEERIVNGAGLRKGRNKSCGCMSPRFTSDRCTKHGMAGTRIYSIWAGMLRRCSDNAKGKTRKNYYAKGIRVCKEWELFENFLRDMGIPENDKTIDRINGNEGYFKNNCRWATRKEQALNTSRNHVHEINGIKKTISEWAEDMGIKPNTLLYRIRRNFGKDRVLAKKPLQARTENMLKRKTNCLVCDKEFIPRKTQIRNGHGKCCSQKCNYQNNMARGVGINS